MILCDSKKGTANVKQNKTETTKTGEFAKRFTKFNMCWIKIVHISFLKMFMTLRAYLVYGWTLKNTFNDCYNLKNLFLVIYFTTYQLLHNKTNIKLIYKIYVFKHKQTTIKNMF